MRRALCSHKTKGKSLQKLHNSPHGPKRPRFPNNIDWYFWAPFAAIAVWFIYSRIDLPLTLSGSYIDEYQHIISGMHYFENGTFAQFYSDEAQYLRGSYVSFLAGLFILLFGKSILVAKVIPATLGILNFFMVSFIARKVIAGKKYYFLFLFLYTVSPYTVFNHFS